MAGLKAYRVWREAEKEVERQAQASQGRWHYKVFH